MQGLKANGVKATKVAAPAGHYYRVLVGETPIAYVNHRNGGGLRVEPRLEGSELPKSIRGFTAQTNVRGGRGYVGTFVDTKGIEAVVVVLTFAAAKVEKEAKAATKATGRSAATARKGGRR